MLLEGQQGHHLNPMYVYSIHTYPVMLLPTAWIRRAAQDLCASAGPQQKQHRIFLSSATLLIVPVNLVSHWQQQIQWHASSLRVAVLDKAARGKCLCFAWKSCNDLDNFKNCMRWKCSPLCQVVGPAPNAMACHFAGSSGAKQSSPQHLAWDHDLVITTFQHLSSGWKGPDKLSSPLLQVQFLVAAVFTNGGRS